MDFYSKRDEFLESVIPLLDRDGKISDAKLICKSQFISVKYREVSLEP